jgi:uncharacterized protein (TIGR03437 family)
LALSRWFRAFPSAAASTPLPTELAGVRVRDALGVERLAPLFFVSPSQINYLMPAGAAPPERKKNIRPRSHFPADLTPYPVRTAFCHSVTKT